MDGFDSAEFLNFIAENGVYGFFEQPIKLKSGRQSHFYANWRTVVSDVFLADKLADYLIAFVKDRGIAADTFFGVPEGATKLGIIAQYKWAMDSANYSKGSHALAMGRAKPKEHGLSKDRYFVGEPRGNVVVVEDVTTTGGSLFNTLSRLQLAGVRICAVISLTNRLEKRDDGLSVESLINGLNLPFYAMSSAPEILPRIYQTIQPGDAIGRAIEQEFQQYGLVSLRLIP